jgi:hypothetical protein
MGFPPIRGGLLIDGRSLSFVRTRVPSVRLDGLSGDLRGTVFTPSSPLPLHADMARTTAAAGETDVRKIGGIILVGRLGLFVGFSGLVWRAAVAQECYEPWTSGHPLSSRSCCRAGTSPPIIADAVAPVAA